MEVPQQKKGNDDDKANTPNTNIKLSSKSVQREYYDHPPKEEEKKEVGQGELYSPTHAIAVNASDGNLDSDGCGGVAVMLLKSKVLEKLLQEAPEASGRARCLLLEPTRSSSAGDIIYEDAVHRIKTRLMVILPLALAFQIVDIAAEEANQILQSLREASRQREDDPHHLHRSGKPTGQTPKSGTPKL